MRALLLVCVGLVRVGAFASLPDSEQIESRNAGSTHVKVRSNAYCGNRVCAGKSCAQSRTTVDAAACAAAVMKDPKCGNSFSFSENSDPNLQYCDCAPVGAPCVATPFAFYDVYELVFDKAAVYTQQQLESAEAQARADAKKGMVTQETYDSKAAECDNAAAPPPEMVESEVAERSLRRSPLNLGKACTGDAARNAGSTPHVKMKTNLWDPPSQICGNRVCANGECAQSRVTVDAAACAAAVLKDPKCGNSFSFGENTDPNLQYCDCPPPGQPCQPSGTLEEGYSVYELIFDVSCGAGTSLIPQSLTCVPDASACGALTLLDPVTMTCISACGGDLSTKSELMAALYKNPNDPYGKELKGDLSGIEDWDVSRIDDFKDVFSGAGSFNADLSKWDVAQGTDFSYMFGSAGSFNGDLSKWDVAQGTYFASMFAGASSFNADLSTWNVAKGSIVAAMFVVAGCKTTNCGCTSCA